MIKHKARSLKEPSVQGGGFMRGRLLKKSFPNEFVTETELRAYMRNFALSNHCNTHVWVLRGRNVKGNFGG